MKETKEIGIVIALPEAIHLEAAKIKTQIEKSLKLNKLEVAEIPNIFHITLFQLNIDIDRLEILKHIVKEIVDTQSSFKIILDQKLQDIQKHIFWSSNFAKNDSDFKDFNYKIVDSIYKLKADLPMFQYRGKDYNEEEKSLIQQYGVPKHPFRDLNPHITISYNSGKDRKNTNGDFIKIQDLIEDIEAKPLEFNVNEVAIVELGESGNIINIIESLYLS